MSSQSPASEPGRFRRLIAGFFAADVIVSALALWAFVIAESRRIDLRHRGLPFVATLTVGVSLALPLFLWQRARHLERAAPA